jgi:hypothetical protein
VRFFMLEFAIGLEQVPPQPIHRAAPSARDRRRVIEQQPDLHRLLVEMRGRELLDSVTHNRAGDASPSI